MKENKYFKTAMIVLLTLVFVLSASFGNAISKTAQAKETAVLSKKKIAVSVGKSKTVRLKNASKVKWSLSKRGIASIKKNGKGKITITGKHPGKTVLKVKCREKIYRYRITVKKARHSKQNTNKSNSASYTQANPPTIDDANTTSETAKLEEKSDDSLPTSENNTSENDSDKATDTATENPVLNATSVNLYYISDTYSQYYEMRENHSSQYTFAVNKTTKAISWSIKSAGAESISAYLSIDQNGTVMALKAPAAFSEGIQAVVTAKIGKTTLQATVTLYNEIDNHIEDIFENFEQTYLTDDMTEYETT